MHIIIIAICIRNGIYLLLDCCPLIWNRFGFLLFVIIVFHDDSITKENLSLSLTHTHIKWCTIFMFSTAGCIDKLYTNNTWCHSS